MNHKQTVFVNEYLKCWNAAEAARLAGYSEKTARVTGHRLLTNVDISMALQQRLAEMTMSADEALVSLTKIARGSMADFIKINDNGIPTLDVSVAANAERLDLIKSFHEGDDGTRIELYDKQAALNTILKAHGVVDKPVADAERELAALGMSADDIAKLRERLQTETRNFVGSWLRSQSGGSGDQDTAGEGESAEG